MSLLGQFIAELDEPYLTFSLSHHVRTGVSVSVRGIIDTGASRICIPTRLAQQVGLRAIGSAEATTASGVVQSTLYAVQVHFPVLGYSRTIEVIAPQNENFETPTLIGMSVLRDFNILFHGRFGSWSFYREG
jgi:predicted aspartyl protease